VFFYTVATASTNQIRRLLVSHVVGLTEIEHLQFLWSV